MKNFVFKLFINLVTFFYEKIFHEKMSDDVKKFFKNLSYIGLGMIIATIFSFTFNILAGRFLGPSGYGEFALVQSVAMFLYIPLLLGVNTAMVKYSSEKDDFKRQSKIISTAYILIILFTVASVTVYYILSSKLSNIFSVSEGIFYLSVVFAILFVFYTLTLSTLRGLLKMKIFAVFQPIFNAILLFAFLFFIFSNILSFKSVVYSMYFAYGITGLIILIFFLRRYLRFEIDKSWTNKLTRYGMFALIGGLSFVFYTNIDKILINRYMTTADIGIYRAYYIASINVAGILFGIFNTVFFPTISKYKNKAMIFKRINKVIPYLIGLGIPFVFLCGFIILRCYGGGYPIDFPLMLIFAITSVLIVWYGLYDWTFCSQGIKGVKLVNIGTVTIAILNVLLNIYLIPRFGLYGAIGSTTISFTAGICCLSLLKRKIV